ncbi:MAG: BLUF domain-containing protein [Verrucomicrobiales bacterium]
MNNPQAPHCLVYVSQATRDFDEGELADLLAVSRRNNAASGITGLLMYESRMFLQALEGPQADVTALFQKIKRDPRHTDVQLVCEDRIEQRYFGPWRMAFQRATDKDLSPGEGFSTLLENYRKGTLSAIDDRLVFALLVLFKERLPLEGMDGMVG